MGVTEESVMPRTNHPDHVTVIEHVKAFAALPQIYSGRVTDREAVEQAFATFKRLHEKMPVMSETGTYLEPLDQATLTMISHAVARCEKLLSQ
jgi:hypothetical protein